MPPENARLANRPKDRADTFNQTITGEKMAGSTAQNHKASDIFYRRCWRLPGKMAPHFDQALKQIQSSCKADGSHPRGKFFFSKNKDIRSTIRHSQFNFAAKELSQMGFDVEVSNQLFLKKRKPHPWRDAGQPNDRLGEIKQPIRRGRVMRQSYKLWCLVGKIRSNKNHRLS